MALAVSVSAQSSRSRMVSGAHTANLIETPADRVERAVEEKAAAAAKAKRDAAIKASLEKAKRDNAAYQKALAASKSDTLLKERDAVAAKVYQNYPKPLDARENRIMDGKLYSKPYPAGTENFREGRDWVKDTEQNRRAANIPLPTPETEAAAKKEIAAAWEKYQADKSANKK